MKKYIIQLLCLVSTIALTACASNLSKSNSAVNQNSIDQALASENAANNSLGGALANNMDELDKSKFTRALDKAPGKETTWTNAMNNTEYTVTPTKKISVGGFQYCRNYQLTKDQGGNTQQYNGNACIGKDGNWQGV